MANVGIFDRVVRLVVGSVFLVFGTQVSGFLMWVLFLLGILLLFSGLLGYCLFYSLFGTSTRKYRVERISKRDIQKAVEQHRIEPESSSLNVAIQQPTEKKKVSQKKVAKKKVTKKSVNKVTKKVPVKKKLAGKKKTSKKVVKKTVKKSTKKSVKKAAKKN